LPATIPLVRIVIQRVTRAAVDVSGERVGAIDGGFLLLVGMARSDTEADAVVAARKVTGLRVFSDDTGQMNLSLRDVGGSVLAVSQFTLLGDVKKGRRPSFVGAADPVVAGPLFDRFVEEMRSHGVAVETGSFGAMMQVSLVNDGPVTIVLDVKDGKIL
jgi:D-tyrosyl-tRNA(Tyr) deacylase